MVCLIREGDNESVGDSRLNLETGVKRSCHARTTGRQAQHEEAGLWRLHPPLVAAVADLGWEWLTRPGGCRETDKVVTQSSRCLLLEIAAERGEGDE